MSVSVIVTDCVMLNCTKKKKLYQQMIQLDETKIREKVLEYGDNEIDVLKKPNDHYQNNDNDDDDDKPTCRI
jgi:hypothetical protein